MTKIRLILGHIWSYLGSMTKTSPSLAVTEGIQHFLSDASHGKRNLTWLSTQTGIARTTLARKMRATPGLINTDELARICAALNVTEADIYRAGRRNEARTAS